MDDSLSSTAISCIPISIRPIKNDSHYYSFPNEILQFFNIRLTMSSGRSQLVVYLPNDSSDLKLASKKLKLFFALFYPGYRVELSPETKLNVKFYNLDNSKHILFKETENKLLQGLEFLEKDITFYDGFALLVNWLDTVEGPKLSGFCPLRDVVNHVNTDSAYKTVKAEYPDMEFAEVDGKMVLSQNEKSLDVYKKKLPQLLNRVKTVFLETRILEKYAGLKEEQILTKGVGGEVGEIIENTRNKWFTCIGCKKVHQCNFWHGYPHSGGYADQNGKKWWLFIVCEETQYSSAYKKIIDGLKTLRMSDL